MSIEDEIAEENERIDKAVANGEGYPIIFNDGSHDRVPLPHNHAIPDLEGCLREIEKGVPPRNMKIKAIAEYGIELEKELKSVSRKLAIAESLVDFELQTELQDSYEQESNQSAE